MRVSKPGQGTPKRELNTELQSPKVERKPYVPGQMAAVAREKMPQSIVNRHVQEGVDFINDLDVTAKQIVTMREKFMKLGYGGRKMTEEICLEILNRICKGDTLKQICSDAHMPNYGTVMKWYHTDPDFQAAMDEAKQFQMNLYADEILEIADNSVGDVRLAYDKNGNLVPEVNYENVKRSELKIKTRQYLMEKFHKKAFGKPESGSNLPAIPGGGALNIQIVLPDNGRQIADAKVVDI